MESTSRVVLLLLFVSLAAGFSAPAAEDADWPQLGREAGRTAHALRGVPPPYRARWIWCGPERTLRNKAAQAAWPDDLANGTQAGGDYPMPEQVPLTLAGRAQPVVAGGRVFIGDIDGKVYGLSLDDGRTLWIGENPGGTCAALVVVGDVVVATAISGGITAFGVDTGRPRWRVETPKAITGAPLVIGGTVFSGGHDGCVYAVEPFPPIRPRARASNASRASASTSFTRTTTTASRGRTSALPKFCGPRMTWGCSSR